MLTAGTSSAARDVTQATTRAAGIRERPGTLRRFVKRIGFLSFGHWRDAPGSRTRSAADSLIQTIELAQAAEEIGIDGAFVRVHHFERQLASPFPLLSAIGAPQGCPNVSR